MFTRAYRGSPQLCLYFTRGNSMEGNSLSLRIKEKPKDGFLLPKREGWKSKDSSFDLFGKTATES